MRFVSIGDCCVDTYPDKHVLGGTAYNSAIIAKKYGADVSIVSAIGNDTDGTLYQNAFHLHAINADHIQIKKTTSAVHITLDKNHSPVFGKWDLGALEKWNLTKHDLDFVQKHDIAKMVLLKPFEKNFTKFCKTKMPQTIKVGDFDGTTQYSYAIKEIKKYIDGLDIVVKGLEKEETKAINFLMKLAQSKKKIVVITLGEKGSICFVGSATYIQKATKREITNTTGFGDAFLAAFLIKYFQTRDVQHALCEATEAIGDVSQN